MYMRGVLCVFRLALEPLSYDLHSFSNTDLCSLRNCSAGPCTTGSRKTRGSWLWRHNSTCFARIRPSASSRLAMTSPNSSILVQAVEAQR
jgi:hypothetical protein